MDVLTALKILSPTAVVAGLWKWSRRPIVRLDVADTPPHAVNTEADVPGMKPIHRPTDAVVNYFRVRAHNVGKTTVRECRVRLPRIWYVERGVWRQMDQWQSVDLVWSGRPGQATLSLNGGDAEFCDVGWVPSSYLQSNVIQPTHVDTLFIHEPSPLRHRGVFILSLSKVFKAQPNALQRGHYVLELRAFSDNARPRRLFMDLKFPGKSAGLEDKYAEAAVGGVTIRQRRKPPDVRSIDKDPLEPVQMADGFVVEP